MNVRTNLFGAIGVFALLAVASVVVSLGAATDNSANDEQSNGYWVEAVNGNLSIFWGEVTKLQDNLWAMENEDGVFVVVASEDTLTAYRLDGSGPTVANVAGAGEPADFMNVLVQEDDDPEVNACNDCTDQACCDNQCEVGGADWCVCTARVTCSGTGGVCKLRIAENECEFVCCDFVEPEASE